nr:uncharacterized protein LOC117275130 [Nicotiana tomentosiformis]
MGETTEVVIAATTDSTNKGVIDSTHHFFLHPSDYPGMNLVFSAFDGKSYGAWRRAVVIALSIKNKLGFIDGTLFIPDENSGLQRSVLYSHNAKDLWNDLEDRFGQTNVAKLFQLQKELSAVVQGVRSNILLTCPLPSLGQAYSMVIQDEKQREIHVFPVYPGESASFIAAQHGTVGKRNNVRDFKGKKLGYEGKKNNSTCSYCKKLGHVMEQCYMLVGFPSDFKFTNQRKCQRLVQGNNTFSTEENAVQTTGIKSLTQENISQILQLLQQVQMGKHGTNSSENNADVNCVGISFSHNCTTWFAYNNNETWILDSGASEHMTFDETALYNIDHLPKPLNVNLPNSHKARVTHSGPSMKRPLVIGRESCGLYVLESRHLELIAKKSSSSRTMMERQFHNKVKIIRSDNAFELGTWNAHADVFSKQGIFHQTTCVGTPQQNEIVERKHKHLLETSRALLYQSHLPILFWEDCVLT